MTSVLITIVWIVCGVLAHGVTFAYFQNQWPFFAYKHRGTDRALAVVFALLGPLGLAVVLLLGECGRYGLRFRGVSREESVRAYRQEFPDLPLDF